MEYKTLFQVHLFFDYERFKIHFLNYIIYNFWNHNLSFKINIFIGFIWYNFKLNLL